MSRPACEPFLLDLNPFKQVGSTTFDKCFNIQSKPWTSSSLTPFHIATTTVDQGRDELRGQITFEFIDTQNIVHSMKKNLSKLSNDFLIRFASNLKLYPDVKTLGLIALNSLPRRLSYQLWEVCASQRLRIKK